MSASEEPRPEGQELEELRELLLPGARARLRALEDTEHAPDAEQVAEVLADAVLLRGDDPALAESLAPTIEKGLEASARKNPQPLADAIYPVLGPAIRKSIQATLQATIDRINAAVESSLTLRGLRMRFESRRAGVSYGEYLLRQNLVYRVEQAFLIERESGLLLVHAARHDVQAKDPDLVSAMLSAITSFAGDSFDAEEGEGVQQITVAGFRVLVSQGPHAVAACVVRGTPPSDLHENLKATNEDLHLRFGPALADPGGNTDQFRPARPRLEALLVEQQRVNKQRQIGMLLPAVALVISFFVVRAILARADANGAFRRAVDAVAEEPGYVVVAREGRSVRGLRDPDARLLDEVLQGTDLAPHRADGWVFHPYQSLDPPIVLARARRRLQPPAGVLLALEGEALIATGTVSDAWVARALQEGPSVAGVHRIDVSGLIGRDRQALEAASEAFTGRIFEQGRELDAVEDLIRLDALAGSAGVRVRVDLIPLTQAAEGPGQRAADDLALALNARRLDHLVVQQLPPATGGAGSATLRIETRIE